MKNRLGAMFFMQIFIAMFFIASAIIILANYNSAGDKIIRGMNHLFGKSNTLTTVVAVVELIAGVILLLDLFVPMPGRTMFIAIMSILILWGINIVMLYIVNDLFKPNFFAWIKEISFQLVIFAGLLGISRD